MWNDIWSLLTEHGFKYFKDCLPQVLFGLFLNLSYLSYA